jgi:capsular exopolysaccharide synthesis family protein
MYPHGKHYVEIEQKNIFKDYIHILMGRKWWVIGTFLTIFTLAILYAFTTTPIYRSMTTLQISSDNPSSQVSLDNRMSMLSGFGYLDDFKQTQYQILQSRSLAWRVIKALNLQEHPDFKVILEANPDASETEIENDMKDFFLGKLNVNPVHNSSVVEVSFQSPDKVMAQKVLNSIPDEYMYLSIDRRNESFVLVKKWLDKQLQDMAAKVQEATKKLYEFGQKSDIYTIFENYDPKASGQSQNVIVQKFVDLSALLTKAQAERMEKEAQFNQIKEKGPNAPLIVNHPLLANLRQQLVTQQAKVKAMQKVFRSGHPEMQAERANLAEINGRLQTEVKRLQESVKADFEAANRTEKLLQESFKVQKEEMVKLQANLTDYQILKRDALTNEQLYQALLARVKEANIASTMVPSNIAVIDPAELPNRPYKPNKLLALTLAGMLGLILGSALAFLLENLDDTVKTTDDLERACGLPSLGAVPLLGTKSRFALSRLKKSNSAAMVRYLPSLMRPRQEVADPEDLDLVVYKHPQNPYTEAIRHAQTAIMLSMSGQPPAAIMITSPNPEEGKSSVVSNLALAFALKGAPTVIIDCDLRRPRVHRIFELDPQPGLTNYLTGSATLDEILRSTEIPGLTVIPGGAKPPSPGNLLDSENFKKLLDHLRQEFRHIIVDTPPVLGFTDARIISAKVDGVLLVTKYQSTHKRAAKLAHQLFSQIHAPVMGAILNCIDTSKYSYGGYYHYNYKYYSKYYNEDR